MTRYIALLRGINVGGKHLLPMKVLVGLLEALGYAGVRTYIQSGNVVFESPDPVGDPEIEALSQAVEDSQGFKPQVLVLNEADLRAAITANPYPTDDGKALHFYFLAAQPENPDFTKLESIKDDTESFTLIDEVFYLHAPNGIGRSKLAPLVERALGVAVTARNWNTVRKIASMLD